MKLSKDEIETVAKVAATLFEPDTDKTKWITDAMRGLLTRKFGDPKPVNPYAVLETALRNSWIINGNKTRTIGGAALALVPALWDAAVAVDETRDDQGEVGQVLPSSVDHERFRKLRSVLNQIREAADGR